MIAGTGIDIVEVDRFRAAMERWGESFIRKIFTDNEISYSRRQRFAGQHFAARFAAKEAVFKAFGGERGSVHRWTDIEVLNDKNGKPRVVFHGSAEKLRNDRNIDKVIVSMTHSRSNAVANAFLMIKPE